MQRVIQRDHLAALDLFHPFAKRCGNLRFVPARLLAILANSLGTLAVVGVAVATLRQRPLANVLIVAGVAIAAAGSALGGLGAAGGAVTIALGVLLLYLGFVGPTGAALRLKKSLSIS